MWQQMIDDLNAAFDLRGKAASERDISSDGLFGAIKPYGPEVIRDAGYPDLDADGECAFVLRALLSNKARDYLWLVNSYCDTERREPFRIDVVDFKRFASTYRAEHENRAMLDGGDVIAFCPATRAIGLLFHDEGHRVIYCGEE
ncbi:MAG: hypothetical protein GC159_11155 [Phycisphaera sp.]|nr:hypothetical protein [Phycisphaera sp.]